MLDQGNATDRFQKAVVVKPPNPLDQSSARSLGSELDTLRPVSGIAVAAGVIDPGPCPLISAPHCRGTVAALKQLIQVVRAP